MKTLFWNTRGLGGGRTFRFLQSLLQEHRLEIVFLMETIRDHRTMDNIKVKLGFDFKLVVDRDGNSGGLCLLWKSSVDVTHLSYLCFHIHTTVISHNNKSWRLTGFYGHPVSI